LNGVDVLAFAFNSIVNDGDFGLFSTGSASFDSTLIETDDPQYGVADPLLAAQSTSSNSATSIEVDVLAPIVEEAKRRLTRELGLSSEDLASLNAITFNVADLGDFGELILGSSIGNIITIDDDAAGYGWFVDSTPSADSEFRANYRSNEASHIDGQMDLLSVVTHELGHALGLTHESEMSFMTETLDAGQRFSFQANVNSDSASHRNAARASVALDLGHASGLTHPVGQSVVADTVDVTELFGFQNEIIGVGTQFKNEVPKGTQTQIFDEDLDRLFSAKEAHLLNIVTGGSYNDAGYEDDFSVYESDDHKGANGKPGELIGEPEERNELGANENKLSALGNKVATSLIDWTGKSSIMSGLSKIGLFNNDK